MSWEYGDEIKTKEDIRKAKAFLVTCLIEGYDDLYKEELDKVREQIKEYEKGFDK